MLLEHEQDYGLGMDAMVTVCSWNMNKIMVLYPPHPPPSPLQKSVQPHGLLQAPSPITRKWWRGRHRLGVAPELTAIQTSAPDREVCGGHLLNS